MADKAAVTRAMWQELRDKEADLGRALAHGAPGVRAPLVPRGALVHAGSNWSALWRAPSACTARVAHTAGCVALGVGLAFLITPEDCEREV